MTYKSGDGGNAATAGAKPSSWAIPRGTRREALLTAYARAVERLGGRFHTGTDMGLDERDIKVMSRVTRHAAHTGLGSAHRFRGPGRARRARLVEKWRRRSSVVPCAACTSPYRGSGEVGRTAGATARARGGGAADRRRHRHRGASASAVSVWGAGRGRRPRPSTTWRRTSSPRTRPAACSTGPRSRACAAGPWSAPPTSSSRGRRRGRGAARAQDPLRVPTTS